MLELRKDPIIGRWVIISTGRGKRPTDFELIEKKEDSKFCPFCAGNETSTPHEIFAFRPHGSAPNSADWTLRVVPNKYPALQIEGQLHRRPDGIYDKMNGIGAHEVIIETPDHNLSLADLDMPQVKNLMVVYRERILDLQKDIRFRYVMIFKNHGKAAGASLHHTHSQLIATPIVPKRVSEEIRGSKTYFNDRDRCIFCDILEQELEDSVRVIEQNRSFVSMSPYAPRFPFETWIVPKQHSAFFENTSNDQMTDLAMILSSTLKRLNLVLENPPYNYLIHNSPFKFKEEETYHWHIEIMPRSTLIAGFEWGTGFHINPTPPEESASFLRDAI
jgi:UDPglucose--hexose-1-phosphate uridylyltransferase